MQEQHDTTDDTRNELSDVIVINYPEAFEENRLSVSDMVVAAVICIGIAALSIWSGRDIAAQAAQADPQFLIYTDWAMFGIIAAGLGAVIVSSTKDVLSEYRIAATIVAAACLSFTAAFFWDTIAGALYHAAGYIVFWTLIHLA